MQLAINGWPPIASHVAVFLVGVFLANIAHSRWASGSHRKPWVVKENTGIVVFPAHVLFMDSNSPSEPPSAFDLSVIRVNAENGGKNDHCELIGGLDLRGEIIGATLRVAGSVNSLSALLRRWQEVKGQRHGDLRFAAKGQFAPLKKCGVGGRVSYG